MKMFFEKLLKLKILKIMQGKNKVPKVQYWASNHEKNKNKPRGHFKLCCRENIP